MIKHEDTTSRSEAGFTLVELAVVMIIIGLLIGGVLKGQELISNAEVTATVSQIKGIDAATTTFRDMYDAMPGDMLTPTTRLPNCAAAPCVTPGNGNGFVDSQLPGIAIILANENASFFDHLAHADLMTGISANGGLITTWGIIYPQAEVGGGFHPAYHPGGALGSSANAGVGHWLSLTQGVAGAVMNPTVITPNQAFRIDNKIDDGNPITGTVITHVAAGAAACAGGNTYNESLSQNICGLHIRFQN